MRCGRTPVLVVLGALAVGGAVVQLAGCGSVYGEAFPASPVDEASSEGGLRDSRTSAEAEAGPPFCSSHSAPRFCADFDEGVDAGFSAVIGDVTLDTASSESPPRSARVSATGTASHLETSLFGAGFAVAQRIAFDIKVDTSPSTSMLFWQIYEASTRCTFQLVSKGTAAALYTSTPDEDGGMIDFSSVLATGPLAGKWSHVAVLLTSKGTAVSIVVTIGNTTALEQQTRCTGLSTNVTMRVGLSTEVQSTGTAHYDNILIEEN